MTMNHKRQNQIGDIAVKLLHRTNCFSYPVDVDKVAKEIGVDVVFYNFNDDISGVLMQENNSVVIGVNSNNHEKRRRFTIAHELGHYILEHQRKGVFVDTPSKYFTMIFRDANSSTGEYQQEREANAFAASLLMPEELVLNAIKKFDTSTFNFENDDLIIALADKFNVSTQAMGLRLSNLELLW